MDVFLGNCALYKSLFFITGCMPITLEATNCMMSPPPSVVMGSSVVFLMNVLSIPDEILGKMPRNDVKQFHETLDGLLSEHLAAGLSELYERSNSNALPLEVRLLHVINIHHSDQFNIEFR